MCFIPRYLGCFNFKSLRYIRNRQGIYNWDRDQNKTKLKSKIELKQCFWSILCYSEFSVIKKHVLKLKKSMDKVHAYELVSFGGTMF